LSFEASSDWSVVLMLDATMLPARVWRIAVVSTLLGVATASSRRDSSDSIIVRTDRVSWARPRRMLWLIVC
jgi:hypothetical protein